MVVFMLTKATSIRGEYLFILPQGKVAYLPIALEATLSCMVVRALDTVGPLPVIVSRARLAVARSTLWAITFGNGSGTESIVMFPHQVAAVRIVDGTHE